MRPFSALSGLMLTIIVIFGAESTQANILNNIQHQAGVLAAANAPWDQLVGRSRCGGLQRDGVTLQPACQSTKGTKTGKAVASCPQGSFFDIGTWSCYTCPDGYDRTANHVDKWDACSKDVPDKRARAKKLGQDQCRDSDIFDFRNGGECWQCPAGYGRTAAAVHEYNACGAAFKQATGATFIARACPIGSFHDPIRGGECWKCPQGYLRTGAHVEQWNACVQEVELTFAKKESALTCKAGEHFDPISGGTCWTCPAQYDRTEFPVTDSRACSSKQMIWDVPVRTMPGIFGIDGVEDMAVQFVAKRTEIDKAIEEFVKSVNGNLELSRQEEWTIIDKAPWRSSILSGLILKRILDAVAKRPSQQTPAEKAAIKSLSEWIQKNRLFIATQAEQAFKQGLAAERIKLTKKQHMQDRLQQMLSVAVVPPDYERLIMAGLQTYGGFGMYLSGFLAVENGFPLFDKIAPHQNSGMMAKKKGAEIVKNVVDNAIDVADDLADDVAKPIFKKLSSKLAKIFAVKGKLTPAGFAGAAAGPIMIISAAVMIAEAEIDKFIQIEKLEITVKNRLRDAKNPVNIVRLLEHENGKDEFLFHWGALTSGELRPSPDFAMKVKKLREGQRFTQASGTFNPSETESLDLSANVVPAQQQTAGNPTAQQNQKVTNVPAATKGIWREVKGAPAYDVAIGMGGVAYVVSSTPAKGVGQVLARASNANQWSPVNGARASRIAVGGRVLWGVGKNHQIFEMQRNKWVPVKGPKAIDIGASAKGVWIVGLDKSVYQRSGNNWIKVPGAQALRIEVDWIGRPLILGRKGELLVHMGGPQWQQLAGSPVAVDLAVDEPGTVRVVGKDGQVYVLNGKTIKWERVTKGGGMTSIGVGGGQVWIVGRKNQIYRQH